MLITFASCGPEKSCGPDYKGNLQKAKKHFKKWKDVHTDDTTKITCATSNDRIVCQISKPNVLIQQVTCNKNGCRLSL